MRKKLKREIINGFEIISYESESKTKNVEKVIEWIEKNIIYIKTINRKHSSYGIKHLIEEDLGSYVSNYDVKYAFAILGVKGVGESINYYYPISEKCYKRLKEEAHEKSKKRTKKD